MRFRQMDGLRAAAALAVVMIHVSAGQTTDAELVWNQLSRFAVPMFLVLTGFGHAGALAEGKFEPQGRTAACRACCRRIFSGQRRISFSRRCAARRTPIRSSIC